MTASSLEFNAALRQDLLCGEKERKEVGIWRASY